MRVLISAIIPVYNAEKYLVECIESLRNQTLKDIEMIFINDGSKDKSLEILNKYTKIDSRIKVLNQENKGPSSARNLGIEISKGDYLSFIDADDFIDKNMYREMYKVCRSLDLDIVVCDRINYYSKKNQIYLKELDLISGKYTKDEINELVIPMLFKDCAFNSMANKLFKSYIVKKNNIKLDVDLYYAEDWKFNVDFFRYAKTLFYIDSAYYYYRKGHKSSSTKYDENTFIQNGIKLYNNRKFYAKYFGLNDKIGAYDLFTIMQHCIASEISRNDIKIKNKISNIRGIINTKEVIEVVNYINIDKLNFKQKLIKILVKNNKSLIIFLYATLARIINKI
ncbi:glycosyltransferase family 2 protein [Clostridium perfringens]|nr:glycosyltransferase family 2 protein [Clostridium perfringens]MDK0703816.1 glycosyltransferase family 2 protein [Clostridium perfringens]MDK0916455.1 glycosyltransferase family 2 protein [Clostridium perfringens]MDM0980413.1 glycosyltransferase family 2 protein [Clostridium perfringens]SQB38899.1 glycosyl transferase [Clostridium perfringens]